MSRWDGGYNTLQKINSPSSKGLSLDAFNRNRVSNTDQRIDVEFIYNKQKEYFEETTSNGTATFNTNSRDVTLSISNTTNGTFAKLSSHPVPYTPGNSQEIEITGVLDLAQIGGGNAEVFLRSSVTGSITEEVITESDWIGNIKGTDWKYSHIFFIDFQSLKVGLIRFGLVKDWVGEIVATIDNDNERNTGYWQSASLPVFYKIYNNATHTYMELGYGNEQNAIGFRYKISTNASATMKCICCTVKSEGGGDLRNMTGLPRAISNGTTVKLVSTSLIPILSIRPKATFNGINNLIISIPKAVHIYADEQIQYKIIHNPTLTGASWVDVNATDSCMEYDVTASAFSGGSEVYSNYIGISAGASSYSQQILLGKTVLWNRQDSVSGILTIVAVRLSLNANVLSSFNWEEII